MNKHEHPPTPTIEEQTIKQIRGAIVTAAMHWHSAMMLSLRDPQAAETKALEGIEQSVEAISLLITQARIDQLETIKKRGSEHFKYVDPLGSTSFDKPCPAVALAHVDYEIEKLEAQLSKKGTA